MCRREETHQLNEKNVRESSDGKSKKWKNCETLPFLYFRHCTQYTHKYESTIANHSAHHHVKKHKSENFSCWKSIIRLTFFFLEKNLLFVVFHAFKTTNETYKKNKWHLVHHAFCSFFPTCLLYFISNGWNIKIK